MHVWMRVGIAAAILPLSIVVVDEVEEWRKRQLAAEAKTNLGLLHSEMNMYRGEY